MTKTKSKWIKCWSILTITVSLVRIQFTRGIYSFRVGRIVESPLINMPVLRDMTDSCEFQDWKDSLIRHCIVFGIADNNVRESLLWVPDSTMNETLEIARATEATQSQLKQMQNMHEVNAEGRRKESSSERNRKRRRTQQMVVLIRLTGSFVSGNIYQTCMYQVLCIWLTV